MYSMLNMAAYVRAAGYPSIKTVVDLRLHDQPPVTLEVLWRWLHDSWATPAPALRAGGRRRLSRADG